MDIQMATPPTPSATTPTNVIATTSINADPFPPTTSISKNGLLYHHDPVLNKTSYIGQINPGYPSHTSLPLSPPETHTSFSNLNGISNTNNNNNGNKMSTSMHTILSDDGLIGVYGGDSEGVHNTPPPTIMITNPHQPGSYLDSHNVGGGMGEDSAMMMGMEVDDTHQHQHTRRGSMMACPQCQSGSTGHLQHKSNYIL
jgi:hypothetical protein